MQNILVCDGDGSRLRLTIRSLNEFLGMAIPGATEHYIFGAETLAVARDFTNDKPNLGIGHVVVDSKFPVPDLPEFLREVRARLPKGGRIWLTHSGDVSADLLHRCDKAGVEAAIWREGLHDEFVIKGLVPQPLAAHA